MGTYARFEELPVWRTAVEVYEFVDELLGILGNRLRFSFRDQLERSALSISNNIAEGFERGTTNELLTFFYIARCSAGEVRSMLTILGRRPRFEDVRTKLLHLRSLAESCSRQLCAWSRSLQASNIPCVRYLNQPEEASRSKGSRSRVRRP